MRVLVTGAGGMLGGDVARACERRGAEVLPLTHVDLDITDGPAVDAEIAAMRPDAVVNCAAWTDVDGAEDHEAEATRTNSEAAGLVAVAAAEVGAKIVHLSSDYVFDGRKRTPYVESDHTGPLSAYGRSKLSGETSVAAVNSKHLVLRSSWLFGAGGRNFVETMLQLSEQQPEVLVVSDQVGCPTYTSHLAGAIAELMEGEAYGVHHVAAAGACSWFEFAQEIFDQSGVECRVMAATTEMLARKAPRPAYSALESERDDAIALSSWKVGLRDYLAERGSGRSEVAA
ncbi:MAG: dTDP-4-dehydrorhamnose reductase [Solirubrobacterales bacterium]